MSGVLTVIFSMTMAIAGTIPEKPNTAYREYDFNGLERMNIKNTGGKISITPMPVNKVTIAILKHDFSDEKCEIDINKPSPFEINTVVSRPGNEGCTADISIQAPSDVNFDVSSGKSDVTFQGVEGKIKVTLTEGSVNADGKIKGVEIDAGAATVDIKGLAGGGRVNSASGDVNISLKGKVENTLTVNTGSGTATLMIPKGSKIKAALESSSGEVANDFSQSYNSDLNLRVGSGSGAVKVKSY